MSLWDVFLPPATDRILRALRRLEGEVNEMKEVVDRLVKEVQETRGQVASMAAFVRGVPELVRAAVSEALATHPGLNPEDLVAISTAADELDAAQAEILAAMGVVAPQEPVSEPAEPTPTPTVEPTTTVETVADGGDFAANADRNVDESGRL